LDNRKLLSFSGQHKSREKKSTQAIQLDPVNGNESIGLYQLVLARNMVSDVIRVLDIIFVYSIFFPFSFEWGRVTRWAVGDTDIEKKGQICKLTRSYLEDHFNLSIMGRHINVFTNI
jgi:hypothetical protein